MTPIENIRFITYTAAYWSIYGKDQETRDYSIGSLVALVLVLEYLGDIKKGSIHMGVKNEV